MPLLSSYDPYDPCMYSSTTNRSMYCVARTKIKPDPTNAVWNYTKVRHFLIKIDQYKAHDFLIFRLLRNFLMLKCSTSDMTY